MIRVSLDGGVVARAGVAQLKRDYASMADSFGRRAQTSGASGAWPGPPSRKASSDAVRPVTALVKSEDPPEEEEEAPNALNTRGAFRRSRAKIARHRAVDAWTCASALWYLAKTLARARAKAVKNVVEMPLPYTSFLSGGG